MILIPLITAIVLFLLGIVIRTGKGSWLIAGYNTMSKDEKAKYDEKAMSRFISNLLFVCAFIEVIEARVQYLKNTPIIVAGYVLIFFITLGAIIYANSGKRFMKVGPKE